MIISEFSSVHQFARACEVCRCIQSVFR